jgi:hypothetical protein
VAQKIGKAVEVGERIIRPFDIHCSRRIDWLFPLVPKIRLFSPNTTPASMHFHALQLFRTILPRSAKGLAVFAQARFFLWAAGLPRAGDLILLHEKFISQPTPTLGSRVRND